MTASAKPGKPFGAGPAWEAVETLAIGIPQVHPQ
jgi:hypothetical protein